jgi:hypothetical protein
MVPYTLPLPRFLEYSGVGETKARELIKRGEIETAVIAGRRMIIVPSYHRFVERQKEQPQDARRNRSGAIPAFGERGRPRHRNKETSPST